MVKKFLRNSNSKKFLMADGGWTDDIAKAMEMISEIHAFESIRRYHIRDNVELYYSFKNAESSTTQWDFAIPFGRNSPNTTP